VEFPQLDEAIKTKRAQIFGLAWISDYPDAENNLALFYGPFEAPNANSFNYKNPEYDKLYERIRSMGPSPERTAIYVKMRDMLIRDAPYVGSMARERFYVVRPWLKNFKPTDNFANWVKYLDVAPAERARK
jgi:ABC-type transport system substrate-binding protein